MSTVIPFVVAEGDSYDRGFIHGKLASTPIAKNINAFWLGIERLFSKQVILNRLESTFRSYPIREDQLDYMNGLSAGSGQTFADILAFNTYKQMVSPEECTVLVAFTDVTETKRTIVLKNSDKVGGAEMVGSNFHKNKEINIVILERPANGPAILAVTAAGENLIKMGINSAGVAVGTNIARTVALRDRKVNLKQLRAADRGWLAKDGILKNRTALSATKDILSRVIENPTATPGNIEFVDFSEGYVIEGSYDQAATSKHTEGTFARTNRFVIMSELNDPKDDSSNFRLSRSTKLLQNHPGKLNVEHMKQFSQDHINGPGLNSICRHSENFQDETSLSAAIMEIDSNPMKSMFHVALGKPCHAWKSKEANLSIGFEPETQNLPSEFAGGNVWKSFYSEACA